MRPPCRLAHKAGGRPAGEIWLKLAWLTSRLKFVFPQPFLQVPAAVGTGVPQNTAINLMSNTIYCLSINLIVVCFDL